ncbi:MAG: hypothetical protein WBV36_08995 [Terriglobales bacterium]
MKSHEKKTEKTEKKKMKSTSAGCVAAMTLLAALTISVPLSSVPLLAQDFTEFDVPGATDTLPSDINSAATIVGNYIFPNNAFGAFVRTPKGRFTTFDVAGAGTGANQGTSAWSINAKGEITGYYVDGSNVSHGYLRSPDGAITSIDVPGAGTGSGQGTLAFNINSEEEIAGEYIDGSNVTHGFVLVPGPGRFTSFDAPGAGTGPGQGTQTASEDGLTRKGAVAGGYVDGNDVVHGLLVLADGTMTTFDVAGAGSGPGTYQGTYPRGIDPRDTISGYYIDGNNVYHGFQRLKHGAVTTFDVPGAGTASGQGTQGENIDAFGVINGQFIDGSNVSHCFLFIPGRGGIRGSITTLPDAPGAGTSPGQGTFVGGSIIPYGERGHPRGQQFAGYYVDQNNLYHGYLMTIFPPPTQ